MTWTSSAGRQRLRKLRAAVGLIAAVTGVAAWFVFLRPQFLGGPATYVVVSGSSMRPTLENGDLVFALERGSYEVGDVVAYRVPKGEVGEGRVVIHRIIGGSEGEGYVIQGDNRNAPDLWHPRKEHIVAERVLVIPWGGIVFGVLRSPMVFASFVGLVAFFAVLWMTFGASQVPPESTAGVATWTRTQFGRLLEARLDQLDLRLRQVGQGLDRLDAPLMEVRERLRSR